MMVAPFPRRWTALLFVLLLLSLSGRAAATPDPDNPARVRVRLSHKSNVESVKLTVKNGPISVRLSKGGQSLMRLQSGETTRLSIRQNDVFVRQGKKGLYARKLHFRPTGGTAKWTLHFEGDHRTYTGGLYLAPSPESSTGLLLVNNVPIEDYVASVVASEYGLNDREGRKAMAVVARTYGLFTSERFGGMYDQADGTASQVYEGAGAVTSASRRATNATRGEVLTYNDNLIQAVYFSSSGGHTADNEAVWDAAESIPYLRGKEDPYDTDSPHHTWSASVDRSALLEGLTRTHGQLVKGFLIGERSADGRVHTIELLQSDGDTHPMNANRFRLVVNRSVRGAPLKSTWFDARRDGDEYVFDGHGFGHGVGLSQWGAHEMAQRGKSYRDILTFYYTGVEIEHLDGIKKDPRDAPVARTLPEDDEPSREPPSTASTSPPPSDRSSTSRSTPDPSPTPQPPSDESESEESDDEPRRIGW